MNQQRATVLIRQYNFATRSYAIKFRGRIVFTSKCPADVDSFIAGWRKEERNQGRPVAVVRKAWSWTAPRTNEKAGS
jgi:hypothetical protein